MLDGVLARDPIEATYLGDHTHDRLLPDPSATAAAERAATIRAQLAELETVPAGSLDERIDTEVLRTALAAELLELNEIREAEWNPMQHNPGGGLHALISREFAPLPDRLESVIARLEAVPDYLAAARERLGELSRVHLDTALQQLDGTLALLSAAIAPAARAVPALEPRVAAASELARQALTAHREWLLSRTAATSRNPRLGERLFRAKLALALDTAFEPAELLSRAQADLEQVTAQLVEVAGRLAGTAHPDTETVRAVFAKLSVDAPTDDTVLDMCRAALHATTAFVREHDLVSVYDDPVVVVAMPEIDRGVAIAYCRENGPLETATLPTEFAVSPTPTGWTPEQVASFYREYNAHMVHELTVHEAMPGHALQLMHANRYQAATQVRSVLRSGSFIEGWAVYAEQLMVRRGYRSAISERAADALAMHQLKMLLRSILNTILDIRFHCDDLDEAAALELMTGSGFQEQGEAIGKWRRVQLTATQLCTYYVGYTEVRQLAEGLRDAQPNWSERQVHDALLAHGSPPPRHLHALLGLPVRS